MGVEAQVNRAARLGLSYVAGYALVAVLGLAVKWAVESVSSIVYGLHWFATMPFIALLFAYVIQKRWAEAARRKPGPA